MSTTIRANMALVSEQQCANIANIDAQKLSSTASKYVEANKLTYYICINTWLMNIRQYSQFGWIYVLDHMTKNGLINCIRKFSEAADNLVQTGSVDDGLARSIMFDVKNHGFMPGVPYDESRNIGFNDLATTLFLFRYPKRFSPLKTDLLAAESVRRFRAIQNRLKLLQRREYPQFVIVQLRETIHDMFDWPSLIRDLNGIELSDICFTPGVGFDSDSTLVSKLVAMSRRQIEYFPAPFGIPLVCQPHDALPIRYWGKGVVLHEQHRSFERHVVKLAAVPKNYKTNRIIAPEDTFRQALARRMFQICDRYLPEQIALHDQSRNQNLAKLGSQDGSLSTLDLSSASDTVSSTLFLDIFPKEFINVMKRILPSHYLYENQEYLLYAVATMGNSMTFWLESVIFYAIASVSCDIAGVNGIVSVYGDDIILPTDAAETCIDILERLGFIVNHDKSFFDPDLRYRESCGEEYLDGINVSSLYYPRFPIEGTLKSAGKVTLSERSRRDSFTGVEVSTLTSLIDLQHKMFKTCVPAAMFLRELLLEANPRLTTSTPDMGLGDIWGYEPMPKLIGAPIRTVSITEDGSVVTQYTRSKEYVRECYSVAVSTHPTHNPHKGVDLFETLYNLYKYQQFLKYGPRYEDELSRLLKVSSPFPSYRDICTKAEVAWEYKPF